MSNLKNTATLIASNKIFELFIVGIIIVNCILIGVETFTDNHIISTIQEVILYIFTIEISLRFIAAESIKKIFL